MITNPPEGHRLRSESVLGQEPWPDHYGLLNRGCCECGAEFSWLTREADHERHVFAVIWDQGASAPYDAMWDGDYTIHNPYEGEK